MLQVDGGRTTMRLMLLLTVCMLPLACRKTEPKPDSTAIVGADVRSGILAEASANYSYGAERPPVPVDTMLIGAPGGDLPVITISTATQTSAAGRIPGSRFIYRLTSDKPYPAMGIAPGVNYVWRDTSAGPEGPYRTLVVPADTSYPMTWLKRDTSVAQYVAGQATEPRLVKSQFGYGACDNNCSPHCASRSSLRSFAAGDTLQLTLKR